MKIAVVLGTRPELIKLAPVFKALKERNIKYMMIRTGQHYSNNMWAQFMTELNIPFEGGIAGHNLQVNNCSHGKMVGLMMQRIDSILIKEKPDLVIVQGDTNCISPESYVEIEGGILKKAGEILKEGTINVKTHKGNYKLVIGARNRSCDVGYKISVSSLSAFPTTFSKEHPILAIKKESKVWRLNKSNKELKFINAEELEVGDYVAYPRPIPGEITKLEVPSLLSQEEMTNFNNLRVKIPKEIKLNNGFAWLLGRYAADGWTHKDKSIYFAIGTKKKKEIYRIKKIIKETLGTEIKEKGEINNCIEVAVHNKQLSLLFKKIVEGKGRDKKLNPLILKFTKENLWAFISGYAQGDGCFFMDGSKPKFNIRTASYQLAYQTRLILLKLGIVASIDKHKAKGEVIIVGNKTISKESYSVNVRGKEALFLAEKVFGIKSPKQNASAKWTSLDKDYVYMRINKIEKVKCPMVIGFEIEGDHTFCVAGVATHNSGLAGALAAAKLGIPVAHLEAGLRSFDKRQPEEHNRIIIDHLATYLFPPTPEQLINLKNEGLAPLIRIPHIVGNTIVDTLNSITQRKRIWVGDYAFVTFHREENVDNPKVLSEILSGLKMISKETDLVCLVSLHPRTKQRMSKEQMQELEENPDIILSEPLNYSDTISAQKHAKVVITDSGGLVEESCILGTPSVVVRQTTDRPEAEKWGASITVGDISAANILKATKEALELKFKGHPYGEDVTEKILEVLL